MAHHLPNYLKTHRKRAGLSQDEVAFLLGYQSGSRVSRYESFGRAPTLEVALACEAVLGIPARELFAGVYEKAAEETRRRAAMLTKRLTADPASGACERKLALLTRLAAGERPESTRTQ
ncbi:MAG: helix-turn-helix transcriptional regulator [Vicinamibacteria bacterium]